MKRTKKAGGAPEGGLPIVHRRAAGLDVGATFHVVAVPAALDPEPVRSFKSFTGDLHRLADWLLSLGISTVAMESTGVYWIPVFEILEARGLEVLLVNARDAKNVPGRKTDVNDAQWIQKLHEHGLLRGSFRPRQEVATLRAFLRHRERLVEYAASHVQHMQKAMMQMNIQLHHVVRDIKGVTGMKIMKAIVDGERDPKVLVQHRDVRCKASVQEMEAALVGNFRPEHVFALRQALELFDSYHDKIRDCDVEIETILANLATTDGSAFVVKPGVKHRAKPRDNSPKFDLRRALFAVTGTDLTQINGIGAHTALTLLGECGDDMSRWPTVKHFTSWLSLAPGSKISGGRVLSSKTRRSANRAAATLRICAVSISRSSTALGAFYRRLSARAGRAKAITATARKLAILFYNALSKGMQYEDPGVDHYEEQYRKRVLHSLKRRAQTLGYELVATAGPCAVS
jgi:transposase